MKPDDAPQPKRVLAAFPVSESGAGEQVAFPSVSPGMRVGGLQIVGELGRGGMGAIYRARDPGLQRDVAVKVLAAGPFATPTQRARFVREGQALARLQHANIVRVHKVGIEGESPFLVMDLLNGESLDTALRESGLFEPRAAVEMALPLVDALDTAHAAGIFHRDLKPANVMLLTDGRSVLVDFGLAKLADASQRLTMSQQMLGTPAYMAPEQITGEEVDARTDVYGLGATLFTLLTGEPPLTSNATLLQELMALTLTQPAPPPSSLRPDVPADLDAIVLKCLAKAPEDRYGSMSELGGDLRRFFDGERVRASSPSALTAWMRSAAKRPALVAGGACLALAALALVSATLYTPQPPVPVAAAGKVSQPRAQPKPLAPETPKPDRTSRAQARELAEVLERAREHRAAGRLADAVADVERALALDDGLEVDPQFAEAFWSAAGQAFSRRDRTKAIRLLTLGISLFDGRSDGDPLMLANLFKDRGAHRLMHMETKVAGYLDLTRALELNSSLAKFFNERVYERGDRRGWTRVEQARSDVKRFDERGRSAEAAAARAFLQAVEALLAE